MLLRNIIANYLGRAWSIFANFLFVPFYIAHLGIGAYGLIVFYTVILTLSATADVGLSATFAREAALHRAEGGLAGLLTTIERMLYTLLAVIAVSLFAGADWIAGNWLKPSAVADHAAVVTSLRLMALSIVPQLGISLYVAGLLGLQRQGAANLIQSAYIAARGGLVIPLIAYDPRIELFFAWQLGVGFVFAIASRSILLRGLGSPILYLGRFEWERLAPLRRYAGGMLAIGVIASLNTQFDKLVVSNLFTTRDLGYYSLASMAGQLAYAATLPILIAALPHWTALHGNGESERVDALYRSYTFVVALLAALATFALMFFSRDVFEVWLPGETQPEQLIAVTRVLTIGGLFLALGAVPFYLGLAHGHNKTALWIGLITVLVTAPAIVILTPRFGLVGAAIPWLSLNFAAFTIFFLLNGRRFYHRSLAKLALSSIAVPCLTAIIAMSAARKLADNFGWHGLSACLIAGGLGAVALALAIGARRNNLVLT